MGFHLEMQNTIYMLENVNMMLLSIKSQGAQQGLGLEPHYKTPRNLEQTQWLTLGQLAWPLDIAQSWLRDSQIGDKKGYDIV